MEVVGVVKDGKAELPASVHLPEGAVVRVIVAPEALAATLPFESEPFESEPARRHRLGHGHRFDS